jgi:competence protein ComEA
MADIKAWFASQSQQTKYKIIALGLALVAIFGFVLTGEQAAAPSPAAEAVVTDVNQESNVKTLFVHVVGEVQRPGIYELNYGSRVADALNQAGGLTAEALESSVNLARVLGDGEQILVRSVHQLAEDDSIISLNRSSARQLEALPGVGPALAARIVEWREKNGGFSAIEQLLEVSGIGAKLFENIKASVTL